MYSFRWVGLLLTLIGSQCLAQKKVEKAEFEFPAMMKENVKQDYLRQCLKGEVLYDQHCGKCHNVKVKRKLVVPDFTAEQVASYDMRLANKAHQTNLGGEEVSTEELVYIINFLTYKKRIGVSTNIKEEEHEK